MKISDDDEEERRETAEKMLRVAVSRKSRTRTRVLNCSKRKKRRKLFIRALHPRDVASSFKSYSHDSVSTVGVNE